MCSILYWYLNDGLNTETVNDQIIFDHSNIDILSVKVFAKYLNVFQIFSNYFCDLKEVKAWDDNESAIP